MVMLTRTGQTPDLGHEPPLDAVGSNAEIIDRREVSFRWLGASIFVGLTGGALIGASIYIAFQGLTSLVEQPKKARTIAYYSQNQDNKATTGIRKGDKLVQHDSSSTENKEGLRLPVTIKVGNREIIKLRHFVRVATYLSPTSGLYATNIPRFNPAKLMTQGEEALPPPEPMPEITDADVSLTKTNLDRIVFQSNQPSFSDSDALAQLEVERSMQSQQQGQSNEIPVSPQFLLSKPFTGADPLQPNMGQGRVGEDLFSKIEVRMIPENVTNIVKDNSQQFGEEDKQYTLKKGESLQEFLFSKGASQSQVSEIIAALQKSVQVSSLTEGQKISLLMASEITPKQSGQILRIILFNDKKTQAIAALSDQGTYVAVAPQDDLQPSSNATQLAQNQTGRNSSEEEEDEDTNESLGTARIYDSLYETAAKNSVPTGLVEEIVRIFGNDVDFQRRVSSDDSIEILYSTEDETGDKPEMLYASFNIDGEKRELYRYQAEDGHIDYLDNQGRSLKRFLLRKPITDGILRSGFGLRSHPILRYAKMHTGVDWANKIGTPILAAGNGTIIMAGWKSGYGQRIEIQHANGYVTSYSHQSRFAAGSVVGAKVRQGQVIGYVGNTGLSTGPHLHYEVEVNGRLVDPMKIRVPRGRELTGPMLADFKRQREQIDSVLEKAGSNVSLARSDAN